MTGRLRHHPDHPMTAYCAGQITHRNGTVKIEPAAMVQQPGTLPAAGEGALSPGARQRHHQAAAP